jgi:hypothetical protein
MSSSHANRDAVARKVNVASALNIAVMAVKEHATLSRNAESMQQRKNSNAL